jgi:DNA transformation protein and related proteins
VEEPPEEKRPQEASNAADNRASKGALQNSGHLPVTSFIMRIADLKNIGEVTAARLDQVGIHTPADLEAHGAVEAYRRRKARFPRETTRMCLYALQAALLDVHWMDLSPQDRECLKAKVEDE